MRPHTLPKSHRRLGSAATCSVLGCSECAWAHYDRIDKRETMDRPPLLPTCVRRSAVFCALASGALSQNQSRAERTGQRIRGAGALSLGALSFGCFVPACPACSDGRPLSLDKAPGTKHPMHIILILSETTSPISWRASQVAPEPGLVQTHVSDGENTILAVPTYRRCKTCPSPTVLRTANHVLGASPHGLLFLRCASGRRP